MVWDIYSTDEARKPRLSKRKERDDKGRIRGGYSQGRRQRNKTRVTIMLDNDIVRTAKIIGHSKRMCFSRTLNTMLRNSAHFYKGLI